MTKKDYIKLAELFNVCKNEMNFIAYTENEKEAITNFMNSVFIPNLSGILKLITVILIMLLLKKPLNLLK